MKPIYKITNRPIKKKVDINKESAEEQYRLEQLAIQKRRDRLHRIESFHSALHSPSIKDRMPVYRQLQQEFKENRKSMFDSKENNRKSDIFFEKKLNEKLAIQDQLQKNKNIERKIKHRRMLFSDSNK